MEQSDHECEHEFLDFHKVDAAIEKLVLEAHRIIDVSKIRPNYLE